MKKYYELSKPQRKQARDLIILEIKENLEKGIIISDKPITAETLNEWATCVAEEAWYPEPEDKVVYNIVGVL